LVPERQPGADVEIKRGSNAVFGSWDEATQHGLELGVAWLEEYRPPN
jgi:hypothetical protein